MQGGNSESRQPRIALGTYKVVEISKSGCLLDFNLDDARGKDDGNLDGLSLCLLGILRVTNQSSRSIDEVVVLLLHCRKYRT